MGRSGKLNPNFGKNISDETRQKLHDVNFGKKLLQKTKEKISSSMKKYASDEQVRLKLSTQNKGAKNGRAKLTPKQVCLIRKKYKLKKYSYSKLALEFNVSGSTIYRIIKNVSWQEIA